MTSSPRVLIGHGTENDFVVLPDPDGTVWSGDRLDAAMVRRLCERIKQKGACAEVEEAAHLLLDQARIVEGEPLPDPAAFSRRLSEVLKRSMAA